MRTTLISRWLEKNNKPVVALFAATATLAMATLIDASSSSQVEQLGLLAVPRTGHAATALADGRVLITGGRDNAGIIVATAEVFDPANETSTAIGILNTARIDHTSTLLADGRVLIAGGTSASGAVTSAEIFDPANPGAGFRVLSATMGAARTRHTATRLHNGTVLIAGGDAAGTAEIFNPTTETFSSALLAMAAPRIGHTATLFSDDSVLLAGGNTDSMEYFSSLDQTFTLDQAKLTATRTGHDAITLSDTHLLFFGGDTGHTIDEFNTSADMLSLKATMDSASSSATLLANGKILVLRPDVAGIYAPDATDQTTAFTPFDETSVPGSTALLRSGQSATELSGDKKILVTGGQNAQHQPTLQIAAFNPARIWTDKDDYQPGDNVILSGSGWKPNENVYLYAVDDTTEAWTYGSTATADANGGFVVNPFFIVQLVQLGANFSVSAVGAQSAMQADVKFTDSKPNTLTVGPPNSVSVTPGGTANYTISVTFNGNGNSCTSPLSITGGLPAGVTLGSPDTIFTPSSVTSTGSTQTASLAITTHAGTAPGTYTFTVLADQGAGGCQNGTASGTGQLVVAGSATHFSVTGFPSPIAAGTPGTFTVTALDANNNVAIGYTGAVTFTSSDSQAVFTPSSYTFVAGDQGVHTFTNGATLKTAGTQSITATQGGNTGTQNGIVVNAGSATKLAITSVNGGSNPTAGTGFSVVVQSQDANGNPANVTATTGVALSLNAGTGTLSGTLTGNIGNNSNSVTINGVTYSKAESGVILTATRTSGNNLTAGNSAPFTVNAGAPNKLVFTTSPVTVTAGVASSTITVQRQDGSGNPITTEATRTVTLSSNSTGTVTFTPASPLTIPSGSSTVSFTYTDTKAGTPTITAASTSPTPITSATQNETVNPAAATKLAFTTQPGNATAGSSFGTQPVINTQDQFGNNSAVGLPAISNVTVALTAGTGPLQGTTTLNIGTGGGNGTVTYTNLRIDVPGTDKQLTASSSTGLTSALSSVFTVSAGAVDHFVFDAISSPQTQNAAFNVTITAKDAANNTVTAFSGGSNKVMISSTGTLSGGTFTSNAFTGGVLTQSVTITNTGNFTITATGLGGGTPPTGTSNNFDVNPATVATTLVLNSVNPNSVAYGSTGPVTFTATLTRTTGGAAVSGATVNFTVDGGAAGSAVTNGSGVATFTTYNPSALSIASHNVQASFTAATISSVSYLGSTSGTLQLTVTKATPTITWANPADITYGTALGTTQLNATATFNNNAVPGSFTYTPAAGTVLNAGNNQTLSVDFTPTDTANYNSVNGTTVHINVLTKALTASIIGNPTKPYDGNTVATLIAANFSLTGVAAGDSITITKTTGSYNSKDVATANTVTTSLATGDFTAGAGTLLSNYALPTTASGPGHIGKADASFTVTPYDVTYDGHEHTASVSAITGVNGETGAAVGTVDVTNTKHTNAGTYNTDSWSFTGTANYNDIAATTISDHIGKADASFTVTAYDVTYDGHEHTASVSPITGVNGETGATVGTVDVSHTAHTNAGTFANDYWTFTGGANYNNIAATTITDHIGKADASFTVTAYDLTYDGHEHSASVSAITGVNGETGATVGTVDVSHTTHTGAGTYSSDYWFFTGTANYNDIGNTTITDHIGKANAIVVVTPYISATTTYDGNPHTATVTSTTGVNGETGASVGTVDVSHTTHTDAGTYATDYWFFAGTANYNDIGNTTITDSIAKADPVVSASGGTFTYDGTPHTGSATAKGVKGEDLTPLNVAYRLAPSGTLLTSAPVNAGSYLVAARFAGNNNYNQKQSDAVSLIINKANAIITVTPYQVTYNGDPHTATGSAIGVESPNPVDLSSLLHLDGTTHTDAGDYPNDSWTFDGNNNYNNDSGTVADSIAKADPVVIATGGTFTYNGNPHAGSATATGVKGEDLGPVNVAYRLAPNGTLLTAAPVNAGSYLVAGRFAGNNNYNQKQSDAASLIINQATLTASIIGDPTRPYNGNTNATLTVGNFSLTGLVGTESFTVTQTSGTYNSKDVATANTVTASLTAGDFTPGAGTLASNYALPTTASGPGHITAVTLTASIIGDPTRPYNGTTTAVLASTNFSLSGLIGSENFTVTQTSGTYNSKDVVSANTVTATLAAADFTPTGGAVATNYVLPTTAGGTGHITTATLTASIIGDPTRPYNGNTNATLTSVNFSLSGLASGEGFSVTQTAGTYNSKDVATANTVTATLSAAQFTAGSGTLVTNYVLPTTASGAGHITALAVTASIIGNPTRQYNGNTNATLTSANFSLSGLIGMENFTVTQTSGTYNSKDVMTANTVTAKLSASDFTAAMGTLASNYVLPTIASGPGQIIKTNATVVVAPYTTANTTYDGLPHTATVTSITGVNGETGATVGTVNVSNTTHTNAGTYAADYWFFTGTSNYNDIGNTTISDSIAKANQTITWTAPANITVGTPLGATQLNATVVGVTGGTPPGALTYTPPAGTVMGAGANQALKVDAAATINYNAAAKTVYINVNYIFVGFLQPIDNLPTLNSAKAGQTIPIKWQLKDASGNLISDLGSLAQNGLTSGSVQCGSAPVDVVEELSAPGSTVFRFDGAQFIYNWQTTKSWAGGCRTLQVRLSDGTSYYAQFTFK